MAPYLFLLLIPSVLSLFNTQKLSLLLWVTTFIIFVTFVGLRLEVGPDWVQYARIHTAFAYTDFWDVILQPEPLSQLLFWFSETAGFHVYLTNVVAAFIMILGVFSFARRTLNPWLAVTAATPYFILVVGMSGIRQTMAAGIMLFLLSRWEKYSFLKRGAYILLAAMFHTSALVNNLLLIAKLNIAMRYKILIGIAILLMTFFLTSEVSMYAQGMTTYKQRYLQGSPIGRSIGSLYHIALIAIPAALGFLFRKRITETIGNVPLLNFGLYASLGVFLFNFFSSTAASRLTIYLYFVPMIIYPALAKTFGRRGKMTMLFSIILFNILILITWFSFGNVSFAYIPYKNVLFDD